MAGRINRAGLFVVLLVCALAIFLFGPNYYKAFPTNGNGTYAAILTLIFLAAAVLFKRSEKLSRYWQITYAFFVASAVNLVSVLFSGYNSTILQAFNIYGARTSFWQLPNCTILCWWSSPS